MNTKSITIITPTYNRAHTLQRVYDSLLRQTFQDFVWLIMDDGSTDETKQLVDEFVQEKKIEIHYIYHENQHKFITVFEGVKKVKTPYFMVVDSDDSYPKTSLEVLFDEVERINNQDEYISVMGLSQYEDGRVVGDPYPGDGFDGSILEMRYRYKVMGDKFGIFITKTYQRLLADFDYSSYQGKGYIPQSVFYNTYDAAGIKTRFVNKIVRTYHFDVTDENSVSNTRWTGKNTYGLMKGYQSFINSYGNQLLHYPKALIRNLVGYQVYSIINKKTLSEINAGLDQFKFISLLLYPLSYLYYKLK
ncbi:glycosyltransferase [Weeksella virosa]|uniref:glycosyltransferase family A protein n=1 Tax=Weeksella virosa TaxID=1014 RepID=UPI0025542380|nr:glycosyltransferase family 2 protein [Weeksella virosa]MDK7374484.1 glycosyltransferase [Weeksella virosa]